MKKLLLACVLAIVLSAVPLAVLANGDTQIIDESGGKTLKKGYGVYTSPHIYGLYAGWTGTAPLIIVNGQDQDRVFFIRLEEPQGLEPGYQALPKECYPWITIASNMVTALAGETIKVPITISIPDDVVYINRHDQIVFQVADITGQFVKIELQSDWFLTTDPYIPLTGPNAALIAIIVTASVIGGCGAYLLVRRKHAKR